MPRILLIDDDQELCEMLQEYLIPECFQVALVHDGEAGVDAALTGGHDAVVLDVMLPRLDGLAVLRRIRAESRVPVLMLTAKGDDVDRIVGLEMGADDYLPKPFNPRELVARLRAILRRAEAPAGETLVVGDMELRPDARVASRAGEKLDLTSTEFAVLEALMRVAGKVASRESLSETALGRKLARHDRGLDMHIAKLRRKLARPGDANELILTVRGVGYQLIRE